jgi:hypothetical protein
MKSTIEGRFAQRRLRVVAAATLAGVALATGAAGSASASEADYDQGYELGLDAYKYGLPLVSTNKTYLNQTSINVANGRGFGPVNRFNPARGLARAEDKSVVAPNHDTLYTIAWLDLKRQPRVIHVPKIKDRYYVLPLMDPYTEDFKNLGSVNETKPGDYAVVGPDGGHVDLPQGVHRIKSKYNRVWIIGRIYIKGEDDTAAVNEIQDEITVTPLRKYGKRGWKPKPPRNPDTTVDDPGLPAGLAFFDKLGELLERYPPPAADQPELDELAAIGVGPGLTPSTNPDLSADTLAGMAAAVADAPAEIQAGVVAAYAAGFAAHNGYLVAPTGRYGTDYQLRAMLAQIGLGAITPKEAIYPVAQVDSSFAPLTGAQRYTIHVAAGQLPPVNAFWSLTMYDPTGFFVPNPIGRYLINDRTDLHYNADGSLDLYVQSSAPADPAQAQNWLPSPAGTPFRLIWRLYATKPDQIQGVLDGSGWDPPTITAVP